jgi:sphingomyelin phosphodiesterase
LVLVDRYANIIRGQLFGHTHEDSFQLIRSNRSKEYAGVALEHLSLSPNYNLYPSYRVYDIDSASYVLTDYAQYRFNLTKANLQDIPEWNLIYRFKEYYNVTDMHDRTFALIAQRIRVPAVSREMFRSTTCTTASSPA